MPESRCVVSHWNVGFQDHEGNFYITDRMKELIKYTGFQVAPAELEGMLLGNEWVEDAGVISFQNDDMHTELPLAFVVESAVCKASKPSDLEKAKEIVNWMDARVAYHNRLRAGVQFITAIPKSPTGRLSPDCWRKKHDGCKKRKRMPSYNLLTKALAPCCMLYCHCLVIQHRLDF
ncbi:hypothetical protein PEBR_21304 [Penicillium brasilianum]|uniref:AMP-binding enzyme C-terminal domain-containing protein n=1 Tax=Penicillium brasilianum TaxID=104259 RepID=A0A1S9RMA9_PENBI|nr:hypothetical protein PEBR_21304 [Penicillium brasilianum]